MSKLDLALIIVGSCTAMAATWVWLATRLVTQRWVPAAIVVSGVAFVVVVVWSSSAYESSRRRECLDRGGSVYLLDDDVCIRGHEEVPLP